MTTSIFRSIINFDLNSENFTVGTVSHLLESCTGSNSNCCFVALLKEKVVFNI